MKKTQKEYNSTNALRYSKKVHGDDNDIDMKIYITESLISVRDKHNPDDTNLTVVSPWHDIPLYCNNNQGILNGIINMVVEIPRHTRNKIEINKHMQINPLKSGKEAETVYNAFKRWMVETELRRPY